MSKETTRLERACRAAYEANMASYAKMTPLPYHLAVLVNEPAWDELEEHIKDHWRAVVKAVWEISP